MTSRPHVLPSMITGHLVMGLHAFLTLRIVIDESSFSATGNHSFANKLTSNFILRHQRFIGIFWSVREYLDSTRSQHLQNHDGDVGIGNLATGEIVFTRVGASKIYRNIKGCLGNIKADE